MVARAARAPRQPRTIAGVRIHDPGHPRWRRTWTSWSAAPATALAYITLPKAASAATCCDCSIIALEDARRRGIRARDSGPCADRDPRRAARSWDIAALPRVRVARLRTDGLRQRPSRRDPGRRDASPRPVRAPAGRARQGEIAAAALANGIVPAHNVTPSDGRPQAVVRRRPARPRRVRLSAHVEHPSGADPAHRRRDEAGSSRGGRAAPPSCSRRKRPTGGRSSRRRRLHDRATIATTGRCCSRRAPPGVAIPAEARRACFAPHVAGRPRRPRDRG